MGTNRKKYSYARSYATTTEEEENKSIHTGNSKREGEKMYILYLVVKK